MSVLAGVSWELVRAVAVVTALVGSFAVVLRLSPGAGLAARLRRRFVLGIPWGTVLTCGFLVAVYLFLQGGLTHPRRPLVTPFRSWSYFYPLGMATAAFSHGSLNHLLGNLTGTVAFAAIAEYAWSHYPSGRGVQTFSRWRTNPYVRILVVLVVSVAVGLFTALFALGPVVGFSGVVFAYAGFALVQRPILATLAILASRVLSLVLNAVRNPRTVASPRPRVVTPWWADVAIQGHAIGILLGVLVGVALAHTRDEWPDPWKLWFGLVAFATAQGLWAIYVPGDSGRYVLFRWAGVALMTVLATVIAVGAFRSRGRTVPVFGMSRRTVALTFVGALLLAGSAAAVPYNVAPVNDQPSPEPSVQVRDYEVGYAENVPNGYVNAVAVPFLDADPQINSSGVIVTSDRRYVWRPVIYPETLRVRGETSVLVGGLGWRERVYADRSGWTLAGNERVYTVSLRHEPDEWTRVFTSEPARADPLIAGRNVSIRPAGDGFEFVVSMNDVTVGTAPVPANGSTVRAGGLTFERNESRVYAKANRTRVAIATRDAAR